MMWSSSSVLRYCSWMTVSRSSAEVARSWAFLRASASSRSPGDASSNGRCGRDLMRDPGRDAVPGRGREAGVRRRRRAEPHDPVEDEQRDDEAERHEDRVVAPWPAGRGDQVVGTGELDGGADRSVAPEPQGDEDGEHAVALLGRDRAVLGRVAHAAARLVGPLSDEGAIRRVDDLPVERPDRDVVPRARIQEDRRDLAGDEIGLRVGRGRDDVAGCEGDRQRVLDDRSRLIDRGGLRLADRPRTHEHRADRAHREERCQGEQQRSGDPVDALLAGHRSPCSIGPLRLYRPAPRQPVVGHGRDMVGIR